MQMQLNCNILPCLIFKSVANIYIYFLIITMIITLGNYIQRCILCVNNLQMLIHLNFNILSYLLFRNEAKCLREMFIFS